MLTLTPAEAALIGRIVAAHTEAEVAAANAVDPASHASLVAKLRRLLGEDAPAVQPDESPDHRRRFDERMEILTHGG